MSDGRAAGVIHPLRKDKNGQLFLGPLFYYNGDDFHYEDELDKGVSVERKKVRFSGGIEKEVDVLDGIWIRGKDMP